MSSPFSAPGAKLTLFVALTMTMLGFVGLSTSFTMLTTSVDELVRSSPTAPVEVAAASEALWRAFLASPLHRALSVANLLASALLLVASFLMTGRTRSAPWWAGQALWANAAYSLAAGAVNVYLLQAHRPALLALVEAILKAESTMPDPLPTSGVEGIPLTMVVITVFAYTLVAGLYLLLLRATKREDVRRFVSREV